LKIYFPNVYDVKYLMKSCKNLKGGLQVGLFGRSLSSTTNDSFHYIVNFKELLGRTARFNRTKPIVNFPPSLLVERTEGKRVSQNYLVLVIVGNLMWQIQTCLIFYVHLSGGCQRTGGSAHWASASSRV
jgi:hypothetical protein